MTFRLLSNSLTDGQRLPKAQWAAYPGLEGDNLSPELHWEGAPEGTRSYVVTVYDPDAPTGSGWWHWVVANIPAEVTSLPEGAGNGRHPLPEGSVAVYNDSCTTDFAGAAPPPGHGDHRYIFTVHALKVESLDLPENPTPAQVGFRVHFNKLASASFTTVFGR